MSRAAEKCRHCDHTFAYHSGRGTGFERASEDWLCAYPAHGDGRACDCAGFDVTCAHCYDSGWYPVRVPGTVDDEYTGPEIAEHYCECSVGKWLEKREYSTTVSLLSATPRNTGNGPQRP